MNRTALEIWIIFLFVGMGFQPAFASQTGKIVMNQFTMELIIDGPTCGIVEVSYEYTFRLTQGGCTFLLYIDWGDGFIDEWDGPYTSPQTKSHIWSESGTYNITAKAHVINGSGYSTTIQVIIIENHPPTNPIINGPIHGKVGVEYTYTFISYGSTCENRTLYYIDWDDGTLLEWIGPYEYGIPVMLNHSWDELGRYTIKAKTKDYDEHGEPSEWGYLTITITKSKENCDCRGFNKMRKQIKIIR